MILEKEPLHLIRLNIAVRVVLALMQFANPFFQWSRHSDLLERSGLAVACKNLLRYKFRDVVVLHL